MSCKKKEKNLKDDTNIKQKDKEKDNKNTASQKSQETSEKDYQKLKEENEKLKKRIKELEEILANSQLQYVSLKNEFDAYQKRIKDNEEKLKQTIFEKIILEIIPILELLMESYKHLPEEFKKHKWAEWLDIVNKKILTFLESKWIEIIPTVGSEVDESLHEVVHIQEVDDAKKKWKIIQEIKKWYVIKTKEGKKVLLPAKVVIWK